MPRLRRLWMAATVVLLVPAFGSGPLGANAGAKSIPIDHVVVLMQENRSFDSYLGRLHFFGQPAAAPMRLSRHNPNPKGGKPISHSNFRRRGWNRAVEETGLKLQRGVKVTPHDARHAFGL